MDFERFAKMRRIVIEHLGSFISVGALFLAVSRIILANQKATAIVRFTPPYLAATESGSRCKFEHVKCMMLPKVGLPRTGHIATVNVPKIRFLSIQFSGLRA